MDLNKYIEQSILQILQGIAKASQETGCAIDYPNHIDFEVYVSPLYYAIEKKYRIVVCSANSGVKLNLRVNIR